MRSLASLANRACILSTAHRVFAQPRSTGIRIILVRNAFDSEYTATGFSALSSYFQFVGYFQ